MKTFYTSLRRITILALLLISTVTFSSYATKHVFTAQNFSFTPTTVSATLGDTIEWQWLNGTHTTSSLTIPAGAATWNANLNSLSLTFDYVPTVTGTYNFQCNIHPTLMMGSFTVACSTPSLTISAGGPTTFCSPGSVVLSQSSVGTFTTYQWKKGNNNVAGATNSSFTATMTGVYKLVATNSCGTATSNGISVTANKAPTATVTPAGPLTICAGQTVTLTANTGAGLTYQWQKNNMNIAGATNNTLVVGAKGNYKVIVTNSVTGCSKASKVVKVTVTCKESTEMISEVTAYPNPSSSYFTLNTSSMQLQNGLVKVFDLTGKLLETENITDETTQVGQNLPAGFYLAKIEVNGKLNQVIKLMKTE